MAFAQSFLVWIKIPFVYLFLLRFPILCLLLLGGFRWIALRFKPDLLADLFDVDGPGMVWVTLTAPLCSWSIFLTGWIIYSHVSATLLDRALDEPGPATPLGLRSGRRVWDWSAHRGVFADSPGQNPSRRSQGLWLGSRVRLGHRGRNACRDARAQ